MRTLQQGIDEAAERGDYQMVKWLSDLKNYVGAEDMTVPMPCWKYVKENTWGQQLRHVSEEIGEVAEAMLDGDADHAAEELTDLITAATTMLEILGYGKERRLVLQAKVNEKNRRRGYWESEG